VSFFSLPTFPPVCNFMRQAIVCFFCPPVSPPRPSYFPNLIPFSVNRPFAVLSRATQPPRQIFSRDVNIPIIFHRILSRPRLSFPPSGSLSLIQIPLLEFLRIRQISQSVAFASGLQLSHQLFVGPLRIFFLLPGVFRSDIGV